MAKHYLIWCVRSNGKSV